VSYLSVDLLVQLLYKINSTILIFCCAIYLFIIPTFSTSQLTTYMSCISFVCGHVAFMSILKHVSVKKLPHNEILSDLPLTVGLLAL
jgi:hypothetical protein